MYQEKDWEYPTLNLTVPADGGMIRSDVATHGCAYVLNINGQEWMIHPNNLTVYGKPKHTKTI